MPGPPNRPPEIAPGPAPPSTPEPPEVRLLRRLVPCHVALLQDTWKGAVPPEIVAPFDRAEAAVRASDFPAATSALDLLSIRLAEPRWPTLAEPFRLLRVPIPAPVPPQWDPDHGLPPSEKEARQARRVADEQLALAEASVAWATAQGLRTEGLPAAVAAAKTALMSSGVGPGFYGAIDRIWGELRGALPPVPRNARSAPRPAASDPA